MCCFQNHTSNSSDSSLPENKTNVQKPNKEEMVKNQISRFQ